MLHDSYEAFRLERQLRQSDRGRVQRAVLENQRGASTRPFRRRAGWTSRVLSILGDSAIAPERSITRRSEL